MRGLLGSVGLKATEMAVAFLDCMRSEGLTVKEGLSTLREGGEIKLLRQALKAYFSVGKQASGFISCCAQHKHWQISNKI